MKFLSEYRDGDAIRAYAQAIRELVTRPWTIMEVCGGQTHAIVRFGLDALLPEQVRLVHGPGCPVCVTPVETIDAAVDLAARPEVIFCTFGDMLRVPGTRGDLRTVKARGGDVRVLYSPLDALDLAARHPERKVVFFAVGFETTAPAQAMLAHQARARGLDNLSLLVSHVLVPPALEAILASPRCLVQGFLAAGHVCTVMGLEEYAPISAHHRVPIVVTGFEPTDILQGVHMVLRQLEEGRAEVENQYARAARPGGNAHAQALLREVFEVVPRRWRGLGEIPRSGLALRPELAAHDAERVFDLPPPATPASDELAECRAGEVLQGWIRPDACPAFGTRCTPEQPLGAPMVSTEGACAAYHRYRRQVPS